VYISNASKILAGIAFASAFALVNPTVTHAQVARSYCLSGAGRMPSQCGFATIPQCLNQGAHYGSCSPRDNPPDPDFAGVNAQAKMIMSVGKRHRR
jgi:hypothetical protein